MVAVDGFALYLLKIKRKLVLFESEIALVGTNFWHSGLRLRSINVSNEKSIEQIKYVDVIKWADDWAISTWGINGQQQH